MGRPRLVVLAVLLAGGVALGWGLTRYGLDPAAAPSGAVLPPAAIQPLEPGQKITFLELGSVGCKPCEAMVPVLDAVRGRYPGQVEVVFHDVKKDPSAAGRYHVRLIPTQVFLLPDGTEFFRHEGYFPEGDVLAVLERMGVR